MKAYIEVAIVWLSFVGVIIVESLRHYDFISNGTFLFFEVAFAGTFGFFLGGLLSKALKYEKVVELK